MSYLTELRTRKGSYPQETPLILKTEIEEAPPLLPSKCRTRPISYISPTELWPDFDRYTVISLEKVGSLSALDDPSLREIALVKGCTRWLSYRGASRELAVVSGVETIYTTPSCDASLVDDYICSDNHNNTCESSEDDSDEDGGSRYGFGYMFQSIRTPHDSEEGSEEHIVHKKEFAHGNVSDINYSERLRSLGYHVY